MTPEQRFDIVLYRLNSAKSLLDEIKDHIERGYYNTAMNRMYYACFYAVSGFYSILFNNRSAADYEDFKNFDLAATQEMYPKVCAFIGLIDNWVFDKN